MQVQSKFDPNTHYVVTGKYVRICRDGDKMTMYMAHIPEQAKRFRPEIQAELMAFWEKEHPLVECCVCGRHFHVGTRKKYCSDECTNAAKNEKAKVFQSQRPQICLWCGAEFRGYSGRKYCGSACKKEARQSQKQEDTRPTWEGHLQEKLQLAESQGTTYAEMQKQETLKMVGRVVI